MSNEPLGRDDHFVPNMHIVNITTPSNYFHVLRRQMKRQYRKPLVVLTPKGILRLPVSFSGLSVSSYALADINSLFNLLFFPFCNSVLRLPALQLRKWHQAPPSSLSSTILLSPTATRSNESCSYRERCTTISSKPDPSWVWKGGSLSFELRRSLPSRILTYPPSSRNSHRPSRSFGLRKRRRMLKLTPSFLLGSLNFSLLDILCGTLVARSAHRLRKELLCISTHRRRSTWTNSSTFDLMVGLTKLLC